ncbi:MAG: ammonium transporter [Bryobacterales bacterium]|nr:ammonium transporter [Bryobacterales bacterium]
MAILGLYPLLSFGQQADTLDQRLKAVEAATAAAQSSADNAWILVSAALVLMMTGPGLALFYGGLVRRKNALSTMMHSFALMAVMSVLWAVVGYSIAFGTGTSFFGGFEYAMLRGVGMEPNATYSATLPHLTFMVFQMMFAVITPALISGAFAERMKFSAMLLFTVLWGLLVYFPLAHMVWGSGGFLNAFGPAGIPCLDFAGGTVVHISSGVSALVCALYLGKRRGYGVEPMKPHNLTLSLIGACLLWVGWFGFNAGSALGASGLAANAFVTTHLGAAAATLGWLLMEWWRDGRPSVLGGISGAVAGLVAITPGAGFVTPDASMVIGFAAGIFCYLMVVVVKKKFGYDDALDAFGIHGAGGFLGALLTGVFATTAVNTVYKDAAGNATALGLLEGNPMQAVNQMLGSLLAAILAAVATFVILKVCDALVGVRVAESHEIDGLDIALHGEEAYNLES